jgi:hypothetical protein
VTLIDAEFPWFAVVQVVIAAIAPCANSSGQPEYLAPVI